MNRALPGHVTKERQALLERYLGAWLTAHALTIRDLGKAAIRDALLQTLLEDLAAVAGSKVDLLGGYLGMQAASLLRKGLSKLVGSG